MGFWLTFFFWVATFVIGDYFRAKLPSQEPSGEGDFQSPTNTEGRKVPQVIGGTVKVKSPNVLWQGDWEAEAVTVETGVIFKRDETVGYRYRIALALGQFQGECAGLTGVYVGEDKVWDYVADNGGVVGTVADINLPDLFGGEKMGGGFVGRIRCFTGTNNQNPSSYLSSRVPLQSAWRGFTYVVVTNQTETGGADIGEANQLRDIRCEFQVYDTIANGGLRNDLALTSDKHIIGRDANPIQAAYRVLNDPDFCIATNDIDYVNFQTVADTCYTEGIGYSQLIDNELEAYEILAEIEKHIDGYIGPNPTTGLIEVKLARADYTASTEFQATEQNIKGINNYAKPEWPQTKNEVKVRFVNREKDYQDDHAVAQDMAGRLIAGRPQSTTIRFPGLRDATAANRICARTARAYFWPLSKFEMEIDRTGWSLRPGDIAVVTHPDIGAVNLPTRVTRIRTGDPVKQTIKVDVVEDVFGDEAGIAAPPQPSGWVPASDAAVAITNLEHILPPRWLFELNGQTIEPRVLWLVAKDAPNNAYRLTWRSRVTPFSGNFSAEVEDETINVFTARGTLRAVGSPEVGLEQLRGTANNGTTAVASGGGFYVDGNLGHLVGSYNPISTFDGLAVINPGGANEEYVGISTIAVDGSGILCSGVIRGLGDSPISDHDPGEAVWFLDSGPYLTPNQRPGDADDQWSMQYTTQPFAPAGAGTKTSMAGEFEVNTDAPKKPYPPTAVIIDQLSTSVWFQAGSLDASQPDSYTSPTGQGLNFEVWNRRFDQSNFVLGADSRDDVGEAYVTNSFSDVNPTLLWWLYDLDTTPSPTQGTDAIASGSEAGLDDRANQKFFDQAVFQAISGLTLPFNCRFEFAWQNQASPGLGDPKVLAGVTSNFTRVDRPVTFLPGEGSKAQIDNTLLLLHFEGFDRTTQVIDYSPFNHTVTVSGGVEIDRDIADDDFGSPERRPGHLLHPTAGASPIPSPQVFCEVTDVSPKAFDQLSVADGFMIQCRVLFTVAPTGSSGEIPLVTKWRTEDNQRQFWLGLNNTTLRFKHSNDGTSELIETTGTRTWSAFQWYEITATVTSGYVQFFVDGVFDEAEPHAFGEPHQSSAPVRIGSDGDGNTVPAITHIDEVRVIKSPLYRAGWTKLTSEYAGRDQIKVLHCNWENATGSPEQASYITDDLNRYTVSFPANEVTTITSAQSKFGTNSLYCGGVNASGFDNSDGVNISETGDLEHYRANWEFRKEDFTMECFVRFNVALASHTGGAVSLITKYYRGLTPFLNWWFYISKTGVLTFAYRTEANVTTELASPVLSPLPTTGQWYHMAAVRSNGEMSLYVDGVRVAYHATDFADVDMLNWGDGQVSLGRIHQNNTADHWALNGWLDEVRVQCGVAEYTGASFTVPTAAFPVDPLPQAAPPAPPAPDVVDVRNPSNWQPNNVDN